MKLIFDEKVAAKEFTTLLKLTDNICIITGAGISTSSGIPDFRGEEGIYTKSDKNVFDLNHFKKNPKLFYEFAKDFLNILKESQPKIYESLGLDEDGPTRVKFLNRLQGEISKRGVVDVLRNGIKHGPLSIDLFYGTPTPGNKKAEEDLLMIQE